ncbi:type 1 glutamine amidotransferase [Rhodococcus oxybenzonivorans]|uniref:type 1 glutamine amidotransferase n=1 Tax=Rhodococcus oxybenzonivorans TaxID=1990687 RepID=UPI002953A821|nr:type 1 glutamine amidotransferase [Rhodococcus oxybenzonivorans]MDV7354520.1 type 1 glutamine amidotransferase [Rhodococcus oxybenzonivorans]
MDKPWAVVKHVSFEGPGLVGALLKNRGISYVEYPMYHAFELPAADDIGGLVVMGGPMGALDDVTHPQLPRERKFIRDSVDAGLPVLGICLGAQLLAAAFGGDVRTGPVPEHGAGLVTVTDEGARDPVFGSAGSQFAVVHWHNDTFDLPEEATRLASSEAYENQAFRLGRRAYGLQFHVELTREHLSVMQNHMPAGTAPSGEHMDEVAAVGRVVIGAFLDLAES